MDVAGDRIFFAEPNPSGRLSEVDGNDVDKKAKEGIVDIIDTV